MKAIIDVHGIVQNVIVLDDGATYNPPGGLSVVDVNPWIKIGDSVDAKEPVSVLVNEESGDYSRVADLKDDLALKAVFRLQQEKKPDLSFSVFIEQLVADKLSDFDIKRNTPN